VKRLLFLALLVPALALAIYDMDTFDLNHWRTPIYNDGRWGIDITIAMGTAAGTWPQPLHNCYVFGAGTWLGAAVGASPRETLTTMFYNPNSGGSEGYPTLCRYWRDSSSVADRIYQYPGEWPPPLSRFPMAPQVPRSDMDMWCCCCDSAPENHIPPGRPLGVDVFQTICGFSDSLAQDFFFLKYELRNCLGDSIRRAYFGPVLDVDIGDGTDDMTGLILDGTYVVKGETIRVTNTAFAYDYDNIENVGAQWESGTPGAIAVMLLSAPDSLGLTAFKRLTMDLDPVADAEQYLTLAGYNYHTGAYEPYDSLPDPAPVDLRMLLSTGPFDLAPDSTVAFWYAVIGSPFGDSAQPPAERDTSELALRCKWARYYFGLLTGIAEETMSDELRTMNVGPTVVRGVLFLPPSLLPPHSSLLSIDGRKVLDLHTGANDVSRLSPGVYFVRSELSAASRRPSAVQKVIITR